MTNTSIENRREHARVLISRPATVTSETGEYTGRILNISAGGAGISMDVKLLDDSKVTVNIENIGMIPATIVRKMKDGVGVKFEISEEKENRFIEQISHIVEMKRHELEQTQSA